MAIVYDGHEDTGKNQSSLTADSSRPNGSLYSRQKRSIADACEWLRLNQSRDRKAIIFCLTSPGFTSLANTPKFISSFVDNMRTNYGMGDYVWVREMTKRGYPHFHFVAHWHPSKWFLDKPLTEKGKLLGIDERDEPMISKLSRYWSSLFDSDAINSIRLGSYHPKTKKRTFYLSTPKHAWYLTKYIGKSIGHGSLDYLIEAGFPFQVNKSQYITGVGEHAFRIVDKVHSLGMYRKTVRSFGMSENVALLSEPELFSEHTRLIDTQSMSEDGEYFATVKTQERSFSNEAGYLTDNDIRSYDWQWTGHGETFIGIDRKRTQK